MWIKREAITKENHHVEVNDPGQGNAIEVFQDSLSEEDKKKDIVNLSPSQQHDYIYALMMFQLQAVGDLSACSEKALIMLASRINRNKETEFSIDVVFEGSKEGVATEEFKFHLKESTKLKEIKDEMEYGAGEAKEPKEKISLLADQEIPVLSIFEQFKTQLKDNEGSQAALATSCALLVFEYVSARNMETYYAGLEGLMDGDKILDKSYAVDLVRKEIALETIASSKFKY